MSTAADLFVLLSSFLCVPLLTCLCTTLYEEAYTHHLLTASISQQFNAFAHGFHMVGGLWRIGEDWGGWRRIGEDWGGLGRMEQDWGGLGCLGRVAEGIFSPKTTCVSAEGRHV